MTTLLSLRVDPELRDAIDARSRALNCNRSKYLVSLVTRDLEDAARNAGHRFASGDLIGSVRTGIRKGDNRTVRAIVSKRLHDKNR
jgi:hypothetical protein